MCRIAGIIGNWRVLVVGIVVIAAVVPNIIVWVGYNSAVSADDKNAIEWVNDQYGSADTYTCNENVAPWIYDRYLELGYVDNIEDADVVITRDEPMTPRCDAENAYYVAGREINVEEPCTLLREFGGVKVYEVNRVCLSCQLESLGGE